MSRQDAMKKKQIAVEEMNGAAPPMKRKQFEDELRKLQKVPKAEPRPKGAEDG